MNKVVVVVVVCTRALMTQKSCAVGMRNAKPGNHLKFELFLSRTRYISSNILEKLSVIVREHPSFLRNF